jgi:hypothetical protein
VATACIPALAAAAQRALGLGVPAAWMVWPLAAAAAALTCVPWLLGRPSLMRTALLMDERLRFKERFSTALALSGSEDAFARAAVAEAHASARRAELSGRFAVRPSRRWAYAGAAWVVAAAVVLFMPTLDLLGYLKHRRERDEQARQLREAREEVHEAVAPVKAAVRQLGNPELAKRLTELENPAAGARPEDVRREAIRRLDDLSREIEKLKGGERLATMRGTAEMLKRLRPTAGGLKRELNRALAEGKFAEAAAMARELREQMGSGELSAEEREALAKQLEDITEQLERLSERAAERAREALEDAGLDGELAKLEGEDLREALKKAGLSEEEIDELVQKLNQCQGTCKRLARLSEGFDCCDGEGLISLDELAALEAELALLEAVRADLDRAEAGQEEIDKAIALLGEGGLAGPRERRELRAGRLGPGAGWGRGLQPADEVSKATGHKIGVKNKPAEGAIIASWYFKGPQVSGEAKRKYQEVVQAGKDRAAEAISEKRIPRKYEESVKKYFDALERAGGE